VIGWVKQWDYCVFGKQASKKKKPAFRKDDDDLPQAPPDSLNRPIKRIMLLSGRAGLGKTTLTGIVAKHAGYNVIEVNASDDRTGGALKARISAAMAGNDIQNGKPNLIVIDEVDGASTAGGDMVCSA
jgi:chromosome transmission fidelity protein 18